MRYRDICILYQYGWIDLEMKPQDEHSLPYSYLLNTARQMRAAYSTSYYGPPLKCVTEELI